MTNPFAVNINFPKRDIAWSAHHGYVNIPFCGYTIVVSGDDNCGMADAICRTEIHVFNPTDNDVTDAFYCSQEEWMICGTAEELLRVMNQIKSMSQQSNDNV